MVLHGAPQHLLVESSKGRSLQGWLTTFFGAPDLDWDGGGQDAKVHDAVSRKYTSDLHSTKSTRVRERLNEAIDPHWKRRASNPFWDDGKAYVREMWGKCLEGDLPADDRRVNQVKGFAEIHLLSATHTIKTSSTALYNNNKQEKPPTPVRTKRARSADDSNNDILPTQK